MSIIAELALIFGICLAGEGIAALLPVAFPSSVIGLILLLVLLFTGVIKTRYIQRVTEFFMANMAFVFVPACVSIMEQFDLIRPQLFVFLGICLLTTPLVYLTTAWTVQGIMVLRARKGKGAADDA